VNTNRVFGYNNASATLTVVAVDGAGLYAVAGRGSQAYLAVYNSADDTRVCKAAFVSVDPIGPHPIYLNPVEGKAKRHLRAATEQARTQKCAATVSFREILKISLMVNRLFE
jgi:hypothetical protein